MEKEKMQRGGHVRIETEIRNIGLRTRKGQVSRSHQVRGVGHIVPGDLQREHGPADLLILDLWPSELWENKFLLFYITNFAVICYGNPRKRIYQLNNLLIFKKWTNYKFGSPGSWLNYILHLENVGELSLLEFILKLSVKFLQLLRCGRHGATAFLGTANWTTVWKFFLA